MSSRQRNNRRIACQLASGYLIEPGDDESFCQAIIHLLRDEELQRALGQEARRRVREKFNWATLVQIVEKAYSIALEKSG